jgi:hypothetical protein
MFFSNCDHLHKMLQNELLVSHQGGILEPTLGRTL